MLECVCTRVRVYVRERQRESLRVDMKKRWSERSWQCDIFYSVQVGVIFCPDKVFHESSRRQEADSSCRLTEKDNKIFSTNPS